MSWRSLLSVNWLRISIGLHWAIRKHDKSTKSAIIFIFTFIFNFQTLKFFGGIFTFTLRCFTLDAFRSTLRSQLIGFCIAGWRFIFYTFQLFLHCFFSLTFGIVFVCFFFAVVIGFPSLALSRPQSTNVLTQIISLKIFFSVVVLDISRLMLRTWRRALDKC